MHDPYVAIGDIHVLASSEAAPGHGVLPVNAYLIRDRAPVLVDTGLPSDRDELLAQLWSLVAPEDLRWVFLTHEDRDHAGNLLQVLETAPGCRLVTNYVTLSKLLEAWSVPLDRVIVVNPGQTFSTGRRELGVLRPPLYDAPGTLGLSDPATGAVFTVDSFGTYLPELVEDLSDVADAEAGAGFADFNRANHPWASMVDRARFGQALDELRRLGPSLLLSSHGVLARGQTDRLVDDMAAVPGMDAFVPPDQARFEALRTEMEGS